MLLKPLFSTHKFCASFRFTVWRRYESRMALLIAGNAHFGNIEIRDALKLTHFFFRNAIPFSRQLQHGDHVDCHWRFSLHTIVALNTICLDLWTTLKRAATTRLVLGLPKRWEAYQLATCRKFVIFFPKKSLTKHLLQAWTCLKISFMEKFVIC